MARVLLADSQPLFNEALEALFSHDQTHVVVGRCSSAEETFSAVGRLLPDLMRVADAVLAGEAAIPRAMLLELARRMAAKDRSADSPLARLSPRERQMLALLSRGWD